MIINKLTFQEVERIINPILKLEDIEFIKTEIYSVLHYTKYDKTDKRQYFVTSNNDGIHTTYKGFDIVIRRLHDPQNDYRTTTIQFKKEKKFMDNFINPNKKLLADLIKICLGEIFAGQFHIWKEGIKPELREEFWSQEGTIDPNWKEAIYLSPLVIFTQEKENNFLIEFFISSVCYERKLNKTILREDWLEMLRHYSGGFW